MSNQNRTNLPSRRFIELAAGTAAAASGLLSTLAYAADLPHVSATDPAAQALGYDPETRNVPSSKYANHRPTQECGNCSLYKGAAGAEWGPCQIFPGKAVHVRGWCWVTPLRCDIAERDPGRVRAPRGREDVPTQMEAHEMVLQRLRRAADQAAKVRDHGINDIRPDPMPVHSRALRLN